MRETRSATKRKEGGALLRYLDRKLILFLEAHSRSEAIQELIDLLDRSGKLRDKGEFLKAVMDRERIVSTGIGIGVAIPHAKISGYADFFVAIGIQKGEGIEWNSIDQLPVKLIFMIGGPDHQQSDYLNILSMITVAVKDPERRKRLVRSRDTSEVLEILKGI